MYAKLDCPRFLIHAEDEVGSVDAIYTGAFPQSFSSNTISVSENIVYNTYNRTHIHQSVSYLNDNGQLRWNAGLDDHWESSFSMDWADALYHTYLEPENGKHRC